MASSIKSSAVTRQRDHVTSSAVGQRVTSSGGIGQRETSSGGIGQRVTSSGGIGQRMTSSGQRDRDSSSLPRFTSFSNSQIPGLDTDFEDGTNVAEALKVVDDLYEKEIRNKNKKKLFLKKMFSFRNRTGSGGERDTLQTPTTPTKENKYMFDPCSAGAVSNITDETGLLNTPDERGSSNRSSRDKPFPPGISRLPPICSPGKIVPGRGSGPRLQPGSSPLAAGSPPLAAGSPPLAAGSPTLAAGTFPLEAANTEKDPRTFHLYYNISPGRSQSESSTFAKQTDSKTRDDLRIQRREKILQDNRNSFSSISQKGDCGMDLEDKITPSAQQAMPIGSRQRRGMADFPPIGGIEGMVPPRPILHQVCNGFKKSDIPNIVIVYSGECETSEQWCAYLKRILNINSDDPCGIHSQPIEDLSTGLGHRKDNRVCEERIYHAKFQVFIISPAFLDWVERWNLDIGRLARPGKLVGLMLGVIDVDLKPIHLQFISNYVEWKVLDLKNEGENEEVTLQVSKMSQELVQKDNLMLSSSESSFRIFPRKINSGQNKLLLLLESPILSSQELEVDITFEGLHLIIEDYKMLKPDCLQIEIPDSAMATSCMASLELFVDRKSLGETKLKLESNFSLFQSVWNNQIQPHKMLSEAYGMKFRSAGELDLYLARTLTARMGAQYSSINTLNPSNTDRINPNSEGEFVMNNQTLLHWAAHNGFRDLASTLLSLGWTIHLNTQDSDKMLPHEIAERAGHTTLATFLRSYRSRMNQSVSKIEEDEEREHISPSDKNEKTGLDGYLIPNKIIDHSVHSVQQQSTKTNNNNNICLTTDNGMILNNGLQSFILTRRMDQNGNIQLAATSQEYMGNNDIQKLQETRNPDDIKIIDGAKQAYEWDSNYDIPRSLAVPLYNNINATSIQDEDITTPTSDPFYLVPPAPRPYSNPPPTPDIGEVMTAVHLSLNKSPQFEDGGLKTKIEQEFYLENFNEVSLHDADTRPASPCFHADTRPASPCLDADTRPASPSFNTDTRPSSPSFNESMGDWKPPLPVIKPCISSPAAINPSTCQLLPLATCQKPANYINLQPGIHPDNSCQTIFANPQTSLATPQTSLATPQKSLASPQTSLSTPQTNLVTLQTNFTSPQTKSVRQQDTCQQSTVRHESPVFKSPLLPPRLRHHSNQERTNTPKIIPDSFRRSSTPLLRSSWSEASPSVGGKGDSEQNSQKKKAAYIKMSRKIPPPLGAFPIPKSGSFGSSQDRVSSLDRRFSSQDSSNIYQNIKSKELRDAAESIQKKPESRKDIIAKLIQDNPTKIGTLPSIPSEGAINKDTSEDKEICGFFNNTITKDLTADSTSKVLKKKNFFLEALKNQDLDFDDGRELKSLQNQDSSAEDISATKKEDNENMSAIRKDDSNNASYTERDNSVKVTSSGKNESPTFSAQLKPFDARSRNDSGEQEKGKIKKLLGRLSPANFGRRSSRQKKIIEVTESPFKPIHSKGSDSEKEKQSQFQEIVDESKEKDDLKDFKKKTVSKNAGELNIRRRTCSPCQIFKVSAPTPPPKLVKATTLPVSDMLTDYDIPRSLTNSRENLFANVTCKNQPLTDQGKATFKVVERKNHSKRSTPPTSSSPTFKSLERRRPSGSSTPRSSLTESLLPRLPPTGRTQINSPSDCVSGSNTANRDIILENKINKNTIVTSAAINDNPRTDATAVITAPRDTKDNENNEERSWEVAIPISISTEKF